MPGSGFASADHPVDMPRMHLIRAGNVTSEGILMHGRPLVVVLAERVDPGEVNRAEQRLARDEPDWDRERQQPRQTLIGALLILDGGAEPDVARPGPRPRLPILWVANQPLGGDQSLDVLGALGEQQPDQVRSRPDQVEQVGAPRRQFRAVFEHVGERRENTNAGRSAAAAARSHLSG